MREPEPESLTPADAEFGAALLRLTPRRPAIDAASIRWEVERRRAARQVLLWRGIAAGLALALTLSIVLRPPAKEIEPIAYAPAPMNPDSSVVTGPARRGADQPMVIPAAAVREGDDYLAVRSRVVAFGVRILPAPAAIPPLSLKNPTPEIAPVPPAKATWLDWMNPLPREGRS